MKSSSIIFFFQNVGIFPLYILRIKRIDKFWSGGITKFWSGGIGGFQAQKIMQTKKKTKKIGPQVFMDSFLSQNVLIFPIYTADMY